MVVSSTSSNAARKEEEKSSPKMTIPKYRTLVVQLLVPFHRLIYSPTSVARGKVDLDRRLPIGRIATTFGSSGQDHGPCLCIAEDAKGALSRGAVATARAIVAHAQLYMIASQITSNELPGKLARKIYRDDGLEKFPANITLWILANPGEGVTKARSLLELARLQLWLEAVRLERRSNNPKLAETLMARVLQECPKSGPLLSETILTAPRVEQKSKSADAIKRNPESPLVIAAVATLFSLDRKTEKARKWFERAVMLDQDWGDSWVRYYAFELEHGTVEQQHAVKVRCVKVEPKHGELWPKVVKDMAHRHKSIGDCLEIAAAQINNR
ncbi:tetratricopeptide repeat protein [Nitzschia inconspicua]|uniref:Tetratricopeptide repeat protein n=1 Tax=Nitzschia inconspicua TaxID=303405 RepID=A0A9K3KSE2_9STRA|nr:tetratricopeptide repeat protein [Nitzschia inconspicua]